jgi:O-antigen/teichoic acid export membrane protein
MTQRLRTGQLKAVLGSLGSSLWIQGFVLVSGVIAARLLGPDDRGYLALIWTVALVVTQLGTLGLPLAVTMELAQGRATVRSLIRDGAKSVLTQTVGVVGAHAVGIGLLTALTDTPAAAAWCSLPVSVAIMAQSFAVAVVQGRSDFATLNRLRLLPVALYAGALVGLAIAGSATLTAVTAVWVAGYLGAAVAAGLVVKKIADAERADSDGPPVSLTDMRRFGRRSLLGWASPTETFRIDQLIVGVFLSAHSLGLYVAALAFTNLPRFFAQGLGLMSYPAVAAAAPRERGRVLVRFAIIGSGVSLATCGLLAALAGPLVTVAFGDEFSPAIGPLRILLAASALLCVRRVLTDGLRGAGFAGAGSRAEALSWGILVPAIAALAPPLGLTGVALALCATYAASLALLSVTALRFIRASLRDEAAPSRPSRTRESTGRQPTPNGFLFAASGVGTTVAAAGLTVALNDPRTVQYALILAIALVLFVPHVWSALHGKFDPLEPIFWFAVMWALQFVLRPLSMLHNDAYLLRGRYDVSTGVTKALVIGLVGALALEAAYALGRRRLVRGGAADRPPTRPVPTPGRVAIALTAGASMVGMLLLFGSNNAEASSSSGAYLYFLPLAATPAIAMLLMRSHAGSRLSLYGALALLTLSVVFSLSYGQRAFVLLPITAALIFWYLRRDARPSMVALALVGLFVFLPVFTVLEVARENDQANPLAVLDSPEVRPGPAIDRFVSGDTTAMFPALALQVRTEGVSWTQAPGSEIVSIVTRPIPSRLWPDKPLSSSESLYSGFFPENYSLNKAGTLFTLAGEFFYDSGFIGVVGWMAIVGYLLARLWRWIITDKSNPWHWTIYAPMFMVCVIGFRGDLALTFGISLFIVGPLLAAYASARSRMPVWENAPEHRANAQGTKVATSRAGSIVTQGPRTNKDGVGGSAFRSSGPGADPTARAVGS